ITTPRLEMRAVNQVKESYPVPCLLVEVKYLSGLQGSNILLIKQEDALVIAGLMLGSSLEQQFLGEMELSAIQEAMNQMMGYMATAMSEMFGQVVEISPPELTICDLADEELKLLDESSPVVELAFTIQVEDFIDSKLIQVIPYDFAKKMTEFLLSGGEVPLEESLPKALSVEKAVEEPVEEPVEEAAALPQADAQEPSTASRYPAAFNEAEPGSEPEVNSWEKLELVRGIPLEVTVILGKTRVPLGELLALNRGGIIALNQAADNPVEIQINNKPVARGEIVLVDEQLGVRITEHLTGL
ncbi:MAG: flagellar motor switch phosphatase FliY, partial [Firmicutes bacterium]|nr:flagellar motor switch phosphatase FliY [Bacillota bacterium]